MLFLESPWPILLLGLAVEVTLAIALIRTGRGALLWAMVGVAIFVLLGIAIERSTITNRKLVTQTLEGAAAALAANDIKQVDAFISPTPDGNPARAKARWALGLVEFMDFSIRNLDVKFINTMSPPTAKATFNVIVHGRGKQGDFLGEVTRVVAMEVELRKEFGRWLIINTPKHDERE